MDILTIIIFALIIFILIIDDKKMDLLRDEIKRLRELTDMTVDNLEDRLDYIEKKL